MKKNIHLLSPVKYKIGDKLWRSNYEVIEEEFVYAVAKPKSLECTKIVITQETTTYWFGYIEFTLYHNSLDWSKNDNIVMLGLYETEEEAMEMSELAAKKKNYQLKELFEDRIKSSKKRLKLLQPYLCKKKK